MRTYNEEVRYEPSQYTIVETRTFTDPSEEFINPNPKLHKVYKLKVGITKRWLEDDKGNHTLLSQNDIFKWFQEKEFDELIDNNYKEVN